MTLDTQARAAGPRAGLPALSRCVSVDRDEFGAQVWGRRALLSTADELPADFTDLFGPDAVDELVSRRGLRTPFLRVAKNGTTLDDRAFTSGAGVGATIADQLDDDKLLRLFADGSTLVLQALHRTWPPLVDFAQSLADELGHPVQVNAYVTPPQSRGFSVHYDVHDVFVLQVQGEKRWQIRAPVLESPLRTQPWTGQRRQVEAAANEEPMLDVVLRPGDCLYLPRGFLHAATALGGVSTHVTVGVHTWTRYAMAEALVRGVLDGLAKEADMRRSLPLGVDVAEVSQLDQDLALVRDRLAALVSQVPGDLVSRNLGRQARHAQRPSPLGPLAQVAAAQQVDGETLVRLRSHVGARLEEDGRGRSLLRTRVGDLPLSSDEAAVMGELLQGESVRLRELRGCHDVAALVRRLLLAGVLVGADE